MGSNDGVALSSQLFNLMLPVFRIQQLVNLLSRPFSLVKEDLFEKKLLLRFSNNSPAKEYEMD